MREYFEGNIDTANLHHLYLIEGSEKTVLGICDFLNKNLGGNLEKNSDIIVETFETFGINESKILRQRHSEAMLGSIRIFVMHVLVFGTEAEQSLLKIFEEPTPNTHFFVIVSSLGSIAETLKSRSQIIFTPREKEKVFVDEEIWLAKNIPERLSDIKKFLDSRKDDETTGRLRHDAVSFLANLEIILHKKWKEGEYKGNLSSVFSDLNKFRDLLNDRGVPVKMYLEHIALTAPIDN